MKKFTILIFSALIMLKAHAVNFLINFTDAGDSSGVPCKDKDGNSYKTVKIGTQIWMAENLKTTTFNDGSPIPLVTDNNTWKDLKTPAYCWLNNDALYKNTYGALYNWHSVNTGRLAPAGWHVPSDSEWTVLTTFLGDKDFVGGKMKEAGTTHWKANNTGATNSSGFTGLPGGYRDFNGHFNNLADKGVFWTTSAANTGDAWLRELDYTHVYINRFDWYQVHGYSIRCIKNDGNDPIEPTVTTASVTNITQTTVTGGGTVSSDGGTAVTARGVCWSTTKAPTIANNKTSDGSGNGIFTSSGTGLTPATVYYLRAYATNSAGTAYGNEVNFFTTDTVKIGSQVWMLKNLDVSTYRNGDPIPKVTDGTAWVALTTGAYCYYNNDSATYAATYGKLYNWYAVNDPRGLAPTGWHVPSDAEWTKLSTGLGGDAVAGCAMKETGITHWKSPNDGATNSSGFTGLPGGFRYGVGPFRSVCDYGYWWSSTEDSTSFAWHHALLSVSGGIARLFIEKRYGFSVRCLRD